MDHNFTNSFEVFLEDLKKRHPEWFSGPASVVKQGEALWVKDNEPGKKMGEKPYWDHDDGDRSFGWDAREPE